jgi:hypothetical protein
MFALKMPAAPTPVILISIDTLRADHLSAHGYGRFRTPNIDSFREHGTLFTAINSQIPLTLPSHTSLFTSTYPFANGVEENAQQVRPNTITLASVLRSRQDYGRARGYYQQALAGAPGDFEALVGAAAAERRLGMMPEVRQHLEKACAIEPDFAECRK